MGVLGGGWLFQFIYKLVEAELIIGVYVLVRGSDLCHDVALSGA